MFRELQHPTRHGIELRARPVGLALASILLTLAVSAAVHAGGGPENLFLVVNLRSWASLTVANHYIQQRDIPSSNVFYLDWDGLVGQPADAALFREKILLPIHAELRRRKLTQQIDYIIYSTDFPYAVSLKKEFQGQNVPKRYTPVASINGLTYLSVRFLAKDLRYLLEDINHYMRQAGPDPRSFETHGFRHWYGWAADGRLLDAGGDHYWLSTMVAMTSGRGNSVHEAISYLSRSAQADGTMPNGTIYYARNPDLRSKAREPAYAGAVAALSQLGVDAEIVSGVLPSEKQDVQGLMTGIAYFRWKESESTILPGAICDNLTSFGGRLNERGGQSPLTDFLRYGAAGACGTVTEPYLINAKFPFPFLHVHYARGCTLAEAFYQSVHGPYQLLIVGDPLCRPWARIPSVTVGGIESDQVVSGSLTLVPSADMPVERFELFIDGQRRATCRTGGKLTLDTARLVDGFHQLRIVAIEASLIESQGRLIVPIRSDNFGSKIEVLLTASEQTGDDNFVTITARATGAGRIRLYQFSRLLGSIQGEQGELRLAKHELGYGPVSIRALAMAGPSASDMVLAKPLELLVAEPSFMPAERVTNWRQLQDGIRVQSAGGAAVAVEDTSARDWLETAGVGSGETYQIDAYFAARHGDELYQFQVRHSGSLTLELNGATVYASNGSDGLKMQYVPIALSSGIHRLRIEGRATGRPRLDIWFGNQGARRIGGYPFKHATD